MTKFSEQLKAWREKNGLTQQQAAEQFGVSKRTYEKWEQGTNAPRGAGLQAVLAKITKGKGRK